MKGTDGEKPFEGVRLYRLFYVHWVGVGFTLTGKFRFGSGFADSLPRFGRQARRLCGDLVKRVTLPQNRQAELRVLLRLVHFLI